jgi:hypothetical protein
VRRNEEQSVLLSGISGYISRIDRLSTLRRRCVEKTGQFILRERVDRALAPHPAEAWSSEGKQLLAGSYDDREGVYDNGMPERIAVSL